MQDFQLRVIAEKAELDIKISKLSEFILSPAFDNLGEIAQDLLQDQIEHMRNYSLVLGLRIDCF